MDKIDYQYFCNNDFVIEVYKGLYFDNSNNFVPKHNYIKIKTEIKDFKLYLSKKTIHLDILNTNEYYLMMNEIDNFSLEYNGIKNIVNFEIKYKDVDLYCLELNVIILEKLKMFDFDLTSEIKNLNDYKILTERLVNIRKDIGKFKRFCYVKGFIFNKEINEMYIKILLETKKLLNIFNNENYYYTEIKKIINNSILPEARYSISIIHKNMFMLEKIFKNYENKIKSLEQPIQTLSKEFKNEESLEQYFSLVAQTNWLETLQENQFCGLLIRTKPNKNFIINQNIDCVEIINITRSTIDLDMYFSFMNQYYNKNKSYDSGTDIPLIKGNGLGEGNVLLPIYINKIHWKLANKFIPIFTALGTTLNPGLFIKNSLYLYHNVLLNMIKDTFKNKNLDDKWLNMLMTMLVTTYEVNKMCEKINWDEFIENPIKRLYNAIPSIGQLLCQFMMDGIEIFRNDKDKFMILCGLILEEYLRRKVNNKFKIEKDQLNLLFIKVMNNEFNFIDTNKFESKRYDDLMMINASILGIIMFSNIIDGKSLKEYLNEFIMNDSILKQDKSEFIKNFVKDNSNIFELEKKKINYLINPLYQSIELSSATQTYSPKKINAITSKYLMKELINDEQLDCLIIQNCIQQNEKSRKISIEKNKYINPYQYPQKVLLNCNDYFKKRIIYETIESIKMKEELLKSSFYTYYQNDKYKNELKEFITNNKVIKELLDSV